MGNAIGGLNCCIPLVQSQYARRDRRPASLEPDTPLHSRTASPTLPPRRSRTPSLTDASLSGLNLPSVHELPWSSTASTASSVHSAERNTSTDSLEELAIREARVPQRDPSVPAPFVSAHELIPPNMSRDDLIYESTLALRGIPHWSDKAEMAAQVQAVVTQGLQKARETGRKALVLIGEDHHHPGSLAVEMAVLEAVRGEHGPGASVMFEITESELEQCKAHLWLVEDRIPADLADEKKVHDAEKDLDAFFSSGTGDVRETRQCLAKMLVALKLGFHLRAFDPEHGTTNVRREPKMVDSIRKELGNSEAPVVVIAGSQHLICLQHNLELDAHLVPLAMRRLPGNEEALVDAARNRHTMTHPAIHRFRPPEDFHAQPFGFLDFAKKLGIDLSRNP